MFTLFEQPLDLQSAPTAFSVTKKMSIGKNLRFLYCPYISVYMSVFSNSKLKRLHLETRLGGRK